MGFLSKRGAAVSMAGLTLLAVPGALMKRPVDVLQPAAGPPPGLNVLEQNVDANGLIRVHEQGTVPVTGTVDIGNAPAVQAVSVTNPSLPVTGSVEVTNFPASTSGIREIAQHVDHFTEPQAFHFDIHDAKRVRVYIVVNGSGTVDIEWETDAGLFDHFNMDAASTKSFLLPEVAGTEVTFNLADPGDQQIGVGLFLSN